MVNRSIFDDLSQQISRLLPQANALGEEARANLSALLQQSFEKMNLLTREEFAVQSRALARAQDRIERLEEEIEKLEKQVDRIDESQADRKKAGGAD